MKRFLKFAAGFGLSALLVTGCGPIPRSTVMLNTGSTPTAVLVGSAASPTPTVQLAVGIPGVLTGGGESAGAGEKTAEPIVSPTVAPTTAPVAGPTATEQFVVGYLLFGTPTPGPGGAAAPATGPTATPTFFIGAFLSTSTPSGQPASGSGATLVPPPVVPTHDMGAMTPTPAAGAGNAGSQQGNAERGKQIFNTTGTCNACHDVRVGIVIVGPSLVGVATRAETRVPGLTAAQYIRQSIMEPNKYVVKGFTANIMPGTLGTTLRPNQINDLIAYLLTLK